MAESLATKAISGFEIKDADRGEVEAIVSVFNVVDRDGDVILPGAIKDGTVVKLSGYHHDIITEGKPPVGRGVLHVDSQKATLKARYFLATERGRESFAQVKEMGTDSEWSIGYPERLIKTAPMTKEWQARGAKRIIAEMVVLESSPVFLGANQYTTTVAVKSAEAQADGVSDDAELLGVAQEALRAHIATKESERATAEQARLDAETKAAADAAADAERLATAERARLSDMATKEFERLERNMRQYRVA